MFTGAQLARLFSLAGVTPESVIHRGQAVVLLHFQKERDDLCARVKARGGRWSQTHRCWYLPRDRRLLEGLLADAGFGLAQLYPEAAAGIQNMQRQIGLKGYSPTTKRNYVQALPDQRAAIQRIIGSWRDECHQILLRSRAAATERMV